VKTEIRKAEIGGQRSENGFLEIGYRHICAASRKLWLIPDNLACYCAQLGKLDECKEWFKKAMAIDEHIVKRAGMAAI
jgi:hypothetical protein